MLRVLTMNLFSGKAYLCAILLRITTGHEPCHLGHGSTGPDPCRKGIVLFLGVNVVWSQLIPFSLLKG